MYLKLKNIAILGQKILDVRKSLKISRIDLHIFCLQYFYITCMCIEFYFSKFLRVRTFSTDDGKFFPGKLN